MKATMLVDNVQLFFSMLEFAQGDAMGQLLSALVDLRDRVMGKNSSSTAPILFSQAMHALGQVHFLFSFTRASCVRERYCF